MEDLEQQPFSIDVAKRDGRTVLSLAGELDIATVGELETAIGDGLAGGDELVLDLRGLEFMDSSGVRALVSGHAAARDGDGSLVIVCARAGTEVARVIEVSGIAGALGMVDEPPGE
jgi:anti-sigma B factor antagonist